MERQVMEKLKDVQDKSTSSPEYIEINENIHDVDFQQCLINIVVSREFSIIEKKLVIFTLKTFHSLISYQVLEPLFPQLLDETIQKDIANLFIYSFDLEYTNQTILPFLTQKIVDETPDILLIKGAIYCYLEYVEKYKIRNNEMIQILCKIFVEIEDLQVEFKNMTIEIIIKQMLLTPPEDEETRNEDLSIAFQLFVSINLDISNIKMIGYILSFINERVYYIDCEDKSNESFNEKLLNVLEMIISICPLSKGQTEITTPLFYLIRIIKELDIYVPFEKLFPILILGEDQMASIENDVDYFFASVMIDSDNRREEEEEEDEDEKEISVKSESSDKQYSDSSSIQQDEDESNDDYSSDDNDIMNESDSYWEKDTWKCLSRTETLNDTQCITRLYIVSRIDDEYIKNAISICFENLNKAPSCNYAILLLFKDISNLVSFEFDPAEFETFGSIVIQYLLLDYCNDKVMEQEINEENCDKNIFFKFMRNFKLREFAESMLSSDDPIHILCIFRLIIVLPREFIDPDIYVAVLYKILTVVFPNLFYIDDKIEILEKVFDYLDPGQSLIRNKENYILSFDKDIREKKSKSIFCQKKEFTLAFKEVAENFFSQALMPVAMYSMKVADISTRTAKIIKYFAAGNIPKYLRRHNSVDESSNDETVVDISYYNIFFPIIVQFFEELIQQNSKEKSINIESFFTIFSKTFINIYIPDNESILNIINMIYDVFVNLNPEDLLQIHSKTMNSVLRVFIKYEKMEKLDSIVFCLRRLDKSNVNYLVYEISLILMNQKKIFSDEIVQEFSIFLRRILKGCPRFYTKSFLCILSRIALYDRDRLEWVLDGENIEEFIVSLISDISINSFKYFNELEQRMIIGLFSMFSSNEQIKKITKQLLYAMIDYLDETFSDPNNGIESYPLKTSFGLIKESTFYDDQDFLSHPLISNSLSELLSQSDDDEKCQNFLQKYPGL